MNRDAQARLTISSPLEAHKPHTIVYSICGVDVGFENPIFAAIELDYEDDEGSEAGTKVLDIDFALLIFLECRLLRA